MSCLSISLGSKREKAAEVGIRMVYCSYLSIFVLLLLLRLFLGFASKFPVSYGIVSWVVLAVSPLSWQFSVDNVGIRWWSIGCFGSVF